jgi:hypothetical protein
MEELKKKEMEDLVTEALNELKRAASALEAPTYPQTPLPRPKQFPLVGGYVWEWRNGGGYTIIRERRGQDTWLERSGAVVLVRACGYQPRQVLRLLRRIQAATAWCEARRQGRERLAQEILRQQKKALEALEAESVIRKLAQ